ncbi:MAG: DUF2917 domain-containing protein [Verrucomicrobiaceae bacterium]|nr:MAG: DUF2917 domain-containing protein [Verrucomicrobiaceae bacterium]
MQTILPSTLGQFLGLNRCHRSIRARNTLLSRNLLNVTAVSRVHCVRGSIWITGANSTEDIVLTAGTTRNFPAATRLVIEALDDSDFELTR